jgi:hypothetical protein
LCTLGAQGERDAQGGVHRQGNLTIRQSPVLGSAAAGVQAEGATSVATIDNCELLFNGTAV